MGIKLISAIRRSLHLAKESSVVTANVPKGHFAVYVGVEHKKRFVIPVSYLNQKWFKDLLSLSEEKFGFIHLMGGITIPCTHVVKRPSSVLVLVHIHCNEMFDQNVDDQNSSILHHEEFRQSLVNFHLYYCYSAQYWPH